MRILCQSLYIMAQMSLFLVFLSNPLIIGKIETLTATVLVIKGKKDTVQAQFDTKLGAITSAHKGLAELVRRR